MEPAVGLSVAVVYSAVVLVMLPLLPGCATGCEYQLLRPSARNDGYIASPDYPQHYSPGFCLMWVYYGRSGVRISMRLLDIDIPSFSDTCTNDFLMVGPINEDIYCGSIDRRSFQEYEAVMTATQNWLFVVFNSTSLGVKGRGFKIYYQLSTATPSSTTSVSTTTQPSYQWSDSRIDISSCQFVFPTEAGEITTNKTIFDCLKQRGKATWLVYHPGSDDTGVSYELIFQRCYLPYPDTVKVYDGYASTANVLSYIRRTCPSYLVTSHHGFLLEYVRRSTREFPNFRIKFVVVRAPQTSTPMSSTGASLAGNPIQNYPDKCIFHLSDPTGEIRSDNLMHAVRNTGYCSWHLHFYASNVRQIIYTLDFEKLQLSSSSIFRIHDGSDRTAAVLGPPFPTRRPFTLISSINSIYIYYVPGVSSDLVTAKDAFNIKFSTVVKCPPGYEACGYRELACFKTENRCDGVWHCPLHGEDERGCTAECPADFSCDFRTSNCYSENDRCNGKGACPNYMDETGCNKELCSAAKGLFLCRNGRCIYEKWRCDRMNDCFDNSDEEECSFTSSPQVVVAAAIGSLICGLLLVVTVGCVCKVYQMRAHHLRGIPSQETPLSRQLAEMFHQRAPPPPYHEAMLTSRPYSEAYLELLNQAENQVESSEASSHDDFSASLTSPDDRSSQRNRQSLHQGLSEDQLPSSQFRTESLVGGDSMPLFLEVFEGDVLHQHSLGITESLPFSEADPSIRALLYCSSSDDESGKNEDRCSDNAGFAGGDEAFVGFDGSPRAHSEAVPSSTTVRSDPTSASPGLHLGDCNGTGACQSEDPKGKEGIRDNGVGIVNAAVSVDSLDAAAEEDCNNLQKSTSRAFDDSDCDCILAGNAAEDMSNEDTDSDTVCILGRI